MNPAPVQVIGDSRGLASLGSGGSAFVPTMGALHEGHAALIRQAAGLLPGGPIVVSIFVNPTQFGPREDFSRYPRQLDADIALAAAAGATHVFAPAADVIYPPGDVVPIPLLPPVASQPRLEDAQRPTHFAGVCQVVARLFDLVRPRLAVFGEKDYQQLLVIEAMVRREQEIGRWSRLSIIRQPTVRESDGLAMSSRNVYLKPEERSRALALVRALEQAQRAAEPSAAEAVMSRTLQDHGLSVDYAVVRHAQTLLPLTAPRSGHPARALIAARLGGVRLIDNMAVP